MILLPDFPSTLFLESICEDDMVAGLQIFITDLSPYLTLSHVLEGYVLDELVEGSLSNNTNIFWTITN